MKNTQSADTLNNSYSIKKASDATDKEELTIAFTRLTEEEKIQFYADCEEGLSPEELRQALHQKIRQLWQG